MNYINDYDQPEGNTIHGTYTGATDYEPDECEVTIKADLFFEVGESHVGLLDVFNISGLDLHQMNDAQHALTALVDEHWKRLGNLMMPRLPASVLQESVFTARSEIVLWEGINPGQLTISGFTSYHYDAQSDTVAEKEIAIDNPIVIDISGVDEEPSE